ncbi:MAG TPA: Abi-alpha family protein [Chitinophagaceae bacterium]|nr:Abi-alpha family protein [Chitinophagaceae bacterium]
MSDLGKLIEAVNIPKRVIDGAEKFLGKLLGPAITETGELISDQIRFRRFKNQVTIFTKANDLISSRGLEPTQVNLKTLAPLIEYSSLEEDEKMQVIWANVIANISTTDAEQAFDLKCIEVLKEITPNEILLLDHLYTKFKHEEIRKLEKWKESDHQVLRVKKFVPVDYITFAPSVIRNTLKFSEEKMALYVDRLISFGIIKYEQPELDESSSDQVIQDIFSGTKQSVSVKSYDLNISDSIHFSNFGIYFVKLCKFNPS